MRIQFVLWWLGKINYVYISRTKSNDNSERSSLDKIVWIFVNNCLCSVIYFSSSLNANLHSHCNHQSTGFDYTRSNFLLIVFLFCLLLLHITLIKCYYLLLHITCLLLLHYPWFIIKFISYIKIKELHSYYFHFKY